MDQQQQFIVEGVPADRFGQVAAGQARQRRVVGFQSGRQQQGAAVAFHFQGTHQVAVLAGVEQVAGNADDGAGVAFLPPLRLFYLFLQCSG